MTDISDKIQQLKNLSGIFTGAGGDRIPPHGTTHTKNGPDPIPSELDGIPVDLDGMSTGETIVLSAGGELVPGAALGSLTDLQTAYDNGGSVTLDAEDLTITLGNSKKLIFKDSGGNAAFTFEDVGADNQITINPDILKLKDSNVTTAIDLSSVGNIEFITTDKSVVGAVNELATAAANYFDKTVDDSDDITEGATNLFLTAAERSAIAGAYIKATDDATDIQMEVGNHDVQHLLDDVVGRGAVGDTGDFAFTDNLDGSCDIAGGDVYLHTTASKGSTGGVFTIPGDTFTLTDGFNNYIYAEYNAGTPRLQATVNPTAIRYVEDKIIVRIVRRDGTTLRDIPFEPGWQSLSTVLTQQFFEAAEGMGDQFAQRLKGDIISTLGTRNPTISSGSYRAGLNRIETPAIDCSAAGTYTQFYGDTGSGWTYNTGQTQLNNTQYYNGAGGLTALNTSRYSVRWVWRLFSVTEMFIQISATNIIDQADAIDSPVPTDLPPLIAQFGQLVGRYIVQQGSDTVLSLPRWESTLSSSGVVTHEATVDKNSEPEFQHYDQSPVAGGTGLSIAESDYFSGGTKAASVKSVGVTLLNTFDAGLTDYDTRNIANDKYLFIGNLTSGVLSKIDRLSGGLIDTATPNIGYRGRIIIDNEIVAFSTTVRVINIETFEYRSFAFISGSVDATGGADINSNGDIYAANVAGNAIYSITKGSGDSYTATTLSPSSAPVAVRHIICDNTYYYIIDLDTSYYIKKYDIATDTLQATSAALPGDPRLFQVIDGNIHLASTSWYKIFDINFSELGSYTHSIGDVRGMYVYDNLMYSIDGTAFTVKIFSLPSLTLTSPRAVDFTQADSFRIAAPVITGIYSAADLIRNGVLQSGALWRDRICTSVVSVETSLPASPVDGALYLIKGGTSAYEGTVAEYISAIGWAIHTPETGAELRYGIYKFVYNYDRWVKRLAFSLTSSVTGTSGTFTMYLGSTGTDLPTLDDGAFWDMDVVLSVKNIGSIAGSGPAHGKWTWRGTIAYSSTDDSAINDSGTLTGYTFSDEITSDSVFSDPTLQLNGSTGAVTISFTLTGATSATYEAIADVSGVVSAGGAFSAV